MQQLIYFVIFGIVRIFGEIVFTSVKKSIGEKNIDFQGHSSLWMFPIYGMAGFLVAPLYSNLSQFSILLRGFIYMVLIFAVEYGTGTILKKLPGNCSWHYNSKYAISGLIRLDYAPVWFIAGLLMERLYIILSVI